MTKKQLVEMLKQASEQGKTIEQIATELEQNRKGGKKDSALNALSEDERKTLNSLFKKMNRAVEKDGYETGFYVKRNPNVKKK